MFRQTLRSLAANKRRFLATAVAVILGVAFMSGTLILTDTLQASYDDLFADINRETDAYVRSDREVNGTRDRIDLSVLDEVHSVSGVRAAAPIVEGYAQLVGPDGKAVEPGGGSPALGAAWIDDADLNPYRIVDGVAPSYDSEIVIDRHSGDTTGYQPGDVVTVLTQVGASEFTIAGITSFGDADNPAGATVVGFTLAASQQHLSAPGRIDAIAVSGDPGISQTDLRDRIATFVDGIDALTGAAITEENQDDVREGIAFITTFLLAFAAVALFVGAFIIHNTFSIVVAQRTKELALLRSLGAGRGQIMGSVVGEAIGVGIVASIGGVIAGIGVAEGLQSLFSALGLDFTGATVLSPVSLLIPFVIGVLVCVGSSIMPGRKATTVAPIAAMRDAVLDSHGPSARRATVGGVLVGLGSTATIAGVATDTIAAIGLGAMAVVFGVRVLGPVIADPVARALGWPAARMRGVTGRIARDNAARNPRRTAATASALMIGITLVGFATIVAASSKEAIDGAIGDSITADLVVNAGRFSPGVTPAAAEAIAGIPGVSAVSAVRYGPAQIDGISSPVVAYDPETVADVIDLSVTEGSMTLLGIDGIAVNTTTAIDNGWALGDEVTVEFPGTADKFTIVALFDEQLVSGRYVVGLEPFAKGFPVDLDQQILVRLSGNDVPATRAAIERAVQNYPTVRVLDRDEFNQETGAQIDQFLMLVQALLGLAIVIALVGIANTLSLSIHERTRELGLLRAVGMSRRQLRSTVRWEAVIIATFGTLVGLLLGVAFGASAVSALGSTGIQRIVIPTNALIVIAMLGACAGVAAATMPARRAARLDVLAAINGG